ncbi:MAG: FAD-dependent oxidoreductase [Eubacteriales bacterium]|nr:FAD-dependent oxidoreductase [Eubacteriales bacterium]
MTYDVAIIGTGPAGLSAALNLKLHNKSILWFGSADLSLKVGKSEKIANYPGFSLVKGSELNAAFQKQIEEASLEITDKMVTMIAPSGDEFMILGDNDIFNAKSILLATGSFTGKSMPGEDELLGMGVSYCATCDGFLYKEKTIGVYCSAKRYEHEVEYLAELADQVYLWAPYKECEINLPNVEKLESPMTEILGEGRVKGIRQKDDSRKEVDGVFLLRSSVAPTKLINGLEMDGAHILVDRKMATNIAGVYAAGDCTGRPYQITKATGEGNVAAHSILDYLASLA